MCIYTYVCKVKSSSVGVFFFRGYNKYSRFGIARIIWSGNRKEETGGKSTTRFFSRDGIILLLLFRCGGVTYVRTYRVSGEALPGELEIGDVGRNGNDEVHCVRVNHSFPHVVQLGLQPWKKKKQNKLRRRLSIVGWPMINYGKGGTSWKSSFLLVFPTIVRHV